MEAAKSELDAKGAIQTAFALFKEFFDGTQKKNVLLESIEYLREDHQWLVTIGFDVGREKETSSTLGFGQRTREPIRETRQFVLWAKDGSLVRMN
jgi:hypothetical protein